MKILAVDLGLARTGIAVSDVTESLASPVKTIEERHLDRLCETVAALAKEKGVGEIVVGHPCNMDGSHGESAQRAEGFAADLQQATGLPVTLWDERLTTVAATGYLNETNVRGKKRKQTVDQVAAVIILQNYLDSRR